ncbi:hypothetical protein SAMN04487943_10984 [Gracilibacillus orientalis]|uniref:YwdI family protein n=1 Tax=Gracilibacillus orientalis TaxID=334253 RepID=A0A1I4NQI1_9BACI|nr:YwdI family protein [Gracilibacillus orientalis]SFM17788.1 hypothetical protein SAMN04487943_10984 [Gracilibacillus orientalis]
MAITNQQILQKIIAECEQALQNDSKVREHAKAVQSLTDLLLDQDSSKPEAASSTNSIDQLEWQQMVGQPAPKPPTKQEKKVEDDGSNGDSLLDF